MASTKYADYEINLARKIEGWDDVMTLFKHTLVNSANEGTEHQLSTWTTFAREADQVFIVNKGLPDDDYGYEGINRRLAISGFNMPFSYKIWFLRANGEVITEASLNRLVEVMQFTDEYYRSSNPEELIVTKGDFIPEEEKNKHSVFLRRYYDGRPELEGVFGLIKYGVEDKIPVKYTNPEEVEVVKLYGQKYKAPEADRQMSILYQALNNPRVKTAIQQFYREQAKLRREYEAYEFSNTSLNPDTWNNIIKMTRVCLRCAKEI